MRARFNGTVRILLVVLVVLLGFSVLLGLNFFYRLDFIPADAASGFHSPYYQYLSWSAARKANRGEAIHVLVIPNNSGGVHDDPEVHRRFALVQAFLGHLAFGDLDVLILVPAIPRTSQDWEVYTHALDLDVFTTTNPELHRPDLQLVSMIDDALERLTNSGWVVRPQVLLFGFSASGMFANRFTLIHPDRVLAVSIGSPGGWPIAPVESWQGHALRYPVGVADLPYLLQRELQTASYNRVPQLFWLGENDTNDSVPSRDGYAPEDAELVLSLFGQRPVDRWPIAAEIYRSVGANAVFHLYPNLAHRPSLRALRDTRTLFRQAMGTD